MNINSKIYKNKYTVFENGTIIGIRGKKLSPSINAYGYEQVSICQNGKTKGELVHRIIAACFIPNPLYKPDVNHIDGNKRNNHVSNLEWNTRKENIAHAWRSGLMENVRLNYKKIGKKYGPISRAKKVINTNTGIIYDTAKDACKSNGFIYPTFSNWLKNNRTDKTSFKYL